MAQLNSPGVVVTVVDESFYTPAAPSTVPLIFVATSENKRNSANTGVARGTLKQNAGLAYLITSQRDLAETFGIPTFRTDANFNPIHGSELNEYGLQSAYSFLGVSNRAYVIRADVDLDALEPKAEPPQSEPEGGTFWFDSLNSNWGIFEWDGNRKNEGRGQTFTKKVPTVITDPQKIDVSTNKPLASVGTVGDYAVVSLSNLNTAWKNPDNIYYRTTEGWVEVGSTDWRLVWPAAVSSVSTLTANGKILKLDRNFDGDFEDSSEEITINSDDPTAVAAQLNAWAPAIIRAKVNAGNRLELYSLKGSFRMSGEACSLLGFQERVYHGPKLEIGPHTRVPLFKTNDPTPRPTGSVWFKTTTANGGTDLKLKKYNTDKNVWELQPTPLYANAAEALFFLDKTGGERLPVGSIYVKYNTTEYMYTYPTLDKGPVSVDYKFYRKNAMGATSITSKVIGVGTLASGSTWLELQETKAGSAEYSTPVRINFTFASNASDAEQIATKINDSSELVNVKASVEQGRVIIRHLLGGDIRVMENPAGSPSIPVTKVITALFDPKDNANLQMSLHNFRLTGPDAVAFNPDWEITHWEPLRFTSSENVITALTADKTKWYHDDIDDVDIMVHDGNKWVGYKNRYPSTNATGPQIRATRPVTQSDNVSALVDNDLWIDTSDIENYPVIYRFDSTLPGPVATRWVKIDNSDQASEDGVVFGDARWTKIGTNADVKPSTIVELLTSNFVDFDCPNPALYPKGILLWNTRRSGFNVKEFRTNYIDNNSQNARFKVNVNVNGVTQLAEEPMANYYPHRWVSISGLQENGAAWFGRNAQRRVVINALQATVNSSRDAREEARVFNLLACPGYPELIGELINLNFDRGLTAFIVGDTPARLTPDATSLKAWGDNLRLAVEDNDQGGASFDEYLGMFYPWGFTSDLNGRNIVVPPSYMMLRTIALSDNVSYPWFAPAGTRRGGITNASAVGYIDKNGEFVTVALNTGARDTLYDVKINPITFFTGVGLVNYGQKTRAKNASALDRINVARLVVYLRRQIDILAKPYVFEPNDKITRDEIKGSIESLLLELVGQRALYDYIVVCDESNNTPSRIDKNELYVDIAVEPVKAVEFIYLPLRLKNTGEISG